MIHLLPKDCLTRMNSKQFFILEKIRKAFLHFILNYINLFTCGIFGAWTILFSDRDGNYNFQKNFEINVKTLEFSWEGVTILSLFSTVAITRRCISVTITIVVNFTNNVWSAFAQISFDQNITNKNCKYRKKTAQNTFVEKSCS